MRRRLWVRGGLPESFLADDDSRSLIWRQDFIRTYLERDIPQLGPRIPAATLHRFWTMLAHVQGGLFNAAQLVRGLAVDGKTVARYLDLLVDLLLVRRLAPFQANIGKRLVKSPKVYVRDSGIVHALLNIGDHEALLGHPVSGASWEGFVIESLIAAAPRQTVPLFYRTGAGAEVDLLLEIPKHGLWAIEIKRGLTARPEKGFFIACDDLKPARRFVVNSGPSDIGLMRTRRRSEFVRWRRRWQLLLAREALLARGMIDVGGGRSVLAQFESVGDGAVDRIRR
jgi:predicted AAA+ superfamily ATPase